MYGNGAKIGTEIIVVSLKSTQQDLQQDLIEFTGVEVGQIMQNTVLFHFDTGVLRIINGTSLAYDLLFDV